MVTKSELVSFRRFDSNLLWDEFWEIENEKFENKNDENFCWFEIYE